MSNGYALLDYYDDFFDHPEYFGDSDHLNNIGSTVLSKRGEEDMRSQRFINQL